MASAEVEAGTRPAELVAREWVARDGVAREWPGQGRSQGQHCRVRLVSLQSQNGSHGQGLCGVQNNW